MTFWGRQIRRGAARERRRREQSRRLRVRYA